MWRSWFSIGRLALIVALTPVIALLSPDSARADKAPKVQIEQQRLEAALNDLGRLGLELKNTFAWFEQKTSLEVFVPFSLRISGAEEQFLLKDYRKAALMLHPLVGTGNRPTEPLFERGVFYLAESHRFLGNKVAAKQHYRRITDSEEYGQTAAHRMVQLAVEDARPRELLYYLNLLESHPDLSPQVAYDMTRGYLLLADYERAVELTHLIPKDHDLHARARFIRATSLVALGKLTEGREGFEDLERSLSAADEAGLRNLCIIHQARILLEQGELQSSHQAYQRVPRDSEHFDDALYEMAWLQLNRAATLTDPSIRGIELNRARGSIDMLLLLSSDEDLRSEARLLLANILMELKREKDAATVFSLNTQRYEPVLDAIDHSIMSVLDPTDWYQKLMASETERRAFLPTLARDVLDRQRGIEPARDLMQELHTARDTVKETRALLDDFRKKIADDPYGNFLPSVRKAFSKARQLERMHNAITKTMKEATRALIEPTLPRPKQVELAEYLAELSQLSVQTEQTGRSNERRRALERSIDRLLIDGRRHLIEVRPEKSHQSARINPELAQLGIQRRELSTQRASLSESITLAREQAYNFTWSRASQLKRLSALIDWAKSVGNELQADLLMQVIESLQAHKEALSTNVELGHHQKRQRDRKTLTLVLQGLKLQRTLLERRFKQTFERERTLLLSGSAEDFESGIWLAISLEQAERVLEHDRGQIEALKTRCREFAKGKLDEIDLLLEREDRLLEEQRVALTLAEARAKRAIGQLTGKAIESTRRHVVSLLMRSDMGLLDVAWWQKEQTTGQINDVLNKSNEKRRRFERDMKIIMQER